MNQIKLLSSQMINKIAAGEVIERPAACVKELVENAIDAGATYTEIYIERAGRNYIFISDNGDGIAKEDLEMAVTRHATSKMDEDKLFAISTMGFRGEALASIGAVSHMSITSKHKNVNDAWKIGVSRGEISEISPAIVQVGTKVEIRDLFFATPARLKFLKSEAQEQVEIVKSLQRIALANKNIDIILRNENKLLLDLRKTEDMALRIKQVVGEEFSNSVVHAKVKSGYVNVEAYAVLPDHVRRKNAESFLYVNKRPVKDKLLIVAVKIAYQNLLPAGENGRVCVFVDVPYDEVDVNVSPTKSEVRFRDGELVKNTVILGIKMAIRNAEVKTDIVKDLSHIMSKPTVNFANTVKPASKQERLSTEQYREYLTSNKSDLQRQLEQKREEVAKAVAVINSSVPQRDISIKAQPNNVKVKEEIMPMTTVSDAVRSVENSQREIGYLGAVLAVIENKYMITQAGIDILLISKEKAYQKYEENKLLEKTVRILLTSAIFYDDKEDNISKLLEHKDMLSSLGVKLQYASSTQILLKELPHVFEQESSCIDILKDTVEYISKNEKIEKEGICKAIASHIAIEKSKKHMNKEQMNLMLREIEERYRQEKVSDIYKKLTVKEIEKILFINTH